MSKDELPNYLFPWNPVILLVSIYLGCNYTWLFILLPIIYLGLCLWVAGKCWKYQDGNQPADHYRNKMFED